MASLREIVALLSNKPTQHTDIETFSKCTTNIQSAAEFTCLLHAGPHFADVRVFPLCSHEYDYINKLLAVGLQFVRHWRCLAIVTVVIFKCNLFTNCQVYTEILCRASNFASAFSCSVIVNQLRVEQRPLAPAAFSHLISLGLINVYDVTSGSDALICFLPPVVRVTAR